MLSPTLGLRRSEVPKLDRGEAASLAALTLVILTCVYAVGWSLQMRFDADQEFADHVELLSRLESRIRADTGKRIGAAPPSAFLSAPTQGIASAQLQTYLAQLADAQHAGLMSSGGEPTKRDEAPDTIRLQATFDISMTSLRGMLYQLETGTPYVFVDALTVQSASMSAGRAIEDPQLRATLSLRAFWQQKTQ
jgi:general secretion pathway protein M